ncbi:hypothetical protein ACIREK_31080 [Streptomyces sp. NPDC102415]|uniref:hypothetical protein n=1 Tax=Streptomyces sp. NPDC102415 TaxID=3366173 RepID=UPI00381A2C70
MSAPDRDPDTGRLLPPQLRPVIPHVCDAGVTPCGKAARLFPGGWRCADHAPRPAQAQEEVA